jgi:hypothetical protein
MTKPGIEPRKIDMRVEHSNHFTIRTLKKLFCHDTRGLRCTVISVDIHCVRQSPLPVP